MNLNGKNKPEDVDKPQPHELANWRLSIGYLRII